MIRAVIFDYGGTLVQPWEPWTEVVRPKAIAAAYADLVRRGLKLSLEKFIDLNKAVFREYSELELRQNRDIPDIEKYDRLIVQLFPNHSEVWQKRTAGEANMAFWKVATTNYHPAKGARRCLTKLKAMGIKMAVVSNHHNHEALVRHLDSLGLDGFFVRIFSSSKVGFRKPDPRIFEKCLSTLKVDRSEAIYVGDSIDYDVAGARAAGMRCIRVDAGSVESTGSPHKRGSKSRLRPRPVKADFKVKTLGEIPRIVGQLNS